jgi:hypothetical protein
MNDVTIKIVVILLAMILGTLWFGPIPIVGLAVVVGALAVACWVIISAARLLGLGIDKLSGEINQTNPEQAPRSRAEIRRERITGLILGALAVFACVAIAWSRSGTPTTDATATTDATPPSCAGAGVAKSLAEKGFPNSEAGLIVQGVSLIGVLPDHTCLVEVITNHHGARRYKFTYDGALQASFDPMPAQGAALVGDAPWGPRPPLLSSPRPPSTYRKPRHHRPRRHQGRHPAVRVGEWIEPEVFPTVGRRCIAAAGRLGGRFLFRRDVHPSRII